MGIMQNMLPVQQPQPQTPAQGIAPNQPAPPPLQPIPVDQLNQEHAGLDAMISRGIPLAKNPKLTSDDIIQELAGLVADDHITAQGAMQTLASLPKGKGGEEVPSSVYQQWLNEKLGRLQSMKASLTKHYGPPIPKKHHEAIKAGTFNPAMLQGGQ